MAQMPSEKALQKLGEQKVIWFSSVRADGRPHLAPIWFVWLDGKIYVSTDPRSVKSKNIRRDGHVALALEDGTSPVICEGIAQPIAPPYSDEIKQAFFQKYEWNLDTEQQYNDLLEVTPEKWLVW